MTYIKPSTSYAIEIMRPSDWAAVSRIYQEGINTGNSTFETTIPSWEDWDAHHLKAGRLVARQDNEVLGWVALTPVSRRQVYRGVADLSIYIAKGARGQGVGKALLRALITEAEGAGIWTLQAGIFPENRASVALHRSCGFRPVGYRERLACLHGVWRDVLLLERRSQVTGTD